MKKIAFLISSDYQTILDKCPDFINEYELLRPDFAQLDAELIHVNWRDETVNWKNFDFLIPKGCWDYPANASEFERFIKSMIEFNVTLKNEAKTILWNMRKTYLLDLQKLDLPVGELLIIPSASQNSMIDVIDQIKHHFKHCEQFVGKPSIGCGGVDAIRFDKSQIDNHQALFKKILSYSDLIIQPYFSEIAEVGEYSYFFFANEFSHAIIKKPLPGDYRAHQLYGAKNISYTPTLQEVEQVLRFVSAAPSPCAYARVDVFKKNQTLYLIELELIEPYLYFELAPKNASLAYCQAVLKA